VYGFLVWIDETYPHDHCVQTGLWQISSMKVTLNLFQGLIQGKRDAGTSSG